MVRLELLHLDLSLRLLRLQLDLVPSELLLDHKI